MLYIVDVRVTLVALFTLRTTVATTTALEGARVHWYSSLLGKSIEQSGLQRDLEFNVGELLDERGAEVTVTVERTLAPRHVYEDH